MDFYEKHLSRVFRLCAQNEQKQDRNNKNRNFLPSLKWNENKWSYKGKCFEFLLAKEFSSHLMDQSSSSSTTLFSFNNAKSLHNGWKFALSRLSPS